MEGIDKARRTHLNVRLHMQLQRQSSAQYEAIKFELKTPLPCFCCTSSSIDAHEKCNMEVICGSPLHDNDYSGRAKSSSKYNSLERRVIFRYLLWRCAPVYACHITQPNRMHFEYTAEFGCVTIHCMLSYDHSESARRLLFWQCLHFLHLELHRKS